MSGVDALANLPAATDVAPVGEPDTQDQEGTQDGTGPDKQEPKTPPPPRENIATQSTAIEGGDPKLEIKLDKETVDEIIRRFTNRAKSAAELSGKQQRLDPMEQMMVRQDLLTRLESGMLTEEDLALAWYELTHELDSKEIAAGVIIVREPSKFESVRGLPGFNRVVVDLSTSPQGRLDAAGNLINNPNISQYITSIGYDTASGQKIFEDLTRLDQLRIKIEQSFFKGVPHRSLVDRLRRKNTPQGLRFGDVEIDNAFNKTGQNFYTELNTQMQAVLTERIGNRTLTVPAGTTLEGLYAADPLAYLEIELEGSQRAVAEKARTYALEINKGEGYHEVDQAAIQARIDKLREPIKADDLAPLNEAVTKAEAELSEAKTKLADLKEKVPEAEQEVRVRGAEAKKAQKRVSELSTFYKGADGESGQIKDWLTEKDELQKKIDALNEKQFELAKQQQAQQQQRQQQQQNQPSQDQQQGSRPRKGGGTENITIRVNPATEGLEKRIERIDADIKAANEKITEARMAQADADIDLDSANNHLERLQGNTEIKDTDGNVVKPATNGEIKDTEAKIAQLEKDGRAAREKLENSSKEVAGKRVAPEKEQQAKGLEGWMHVDKKRGKIHETNYTQVFGSEFTIKALSDTMHRTDGQIEGMERIRALILQTVNKAGYDPELARKMLSDETIARGIIDYFRLGDTNITIRGITGDFDSFLMDLNLDQDRLRNTPARNTAVRRTLEQQIKQKSDEISLQALTFLGRAPQMEIGSFINRVIDNGLIQAELGNPYLRMVR